MWMWKPMGAVAAVLLLFFQGIAAAKPDTPRLAETTKLFLHIDVPRSGVGGTFEMSLSVDDYPDGGNNTGIIYDGAPNEVLLATGLQEPKSTSFPTVDGVPLRVDASSPITGVIAIGVFQIVVDTVGVPVGGGAATLELKLEGELASGRKMTIGEQQIEYLVTPAQNTYPLDVNIQPGKSSHGKRFSSLTLTTLVRGPSVMTGFFELDDPASFIEIPSLGL